MTNHGQLILNSDSQTFSQHLEEYRTDDPRWGGTGPSRKRRVSDQFGESEDSDFFNVHRKAPQVPTALDIPIRPGVVKDWSSMERLFMSSGSGETVLQGTLRS